MVVYDCFASFCGLFCLVLCLLPRSVLVFGYCLSFLCFNVVGFWLDICFMWGFVLTFCGGLDLVVGC